MTTTPQALRRGDLIAIVSPSARLNNIFPHRIERARVYLQNDLGFKVKVIFNTSVASSTFATAVQQRCEELHDAFRDCEVKAIVCAIGGLSSNELLRHLDYGLIAANPKIFVGYSDITLLHHAFSTQANLRTFYGPAAITQWGEYPHPQSFTRDNFLHVLCDSEGKPPGSVPRSKEWTQEFLDWETGADSTRARHMQPSSGWRWLRNGSAKGKLLGGCLPSMLQLAGTKYMPRLKGCILFLENPESSEKVDGPYPLERTQSNVADLVNMGVFDEVVGLVLGRPFQYDEAMTMAYEKVFSDQCSAAGMQFPILANVDIGHTDPIVTLPLGCEAGLNSVRDEFVIAEAATTARVD